MRRFTVLAVSALVLCLGIGAATASAHAGRGSAALAQFRACMKEHGAPQPVPHRRPTAGEVAAWKQAFAACRALLPGRFGHGFGHAFTRPTPAQVEAFKTCMAGKGFTLGKPSSAQRPDFRDKAVRDAFKSAFQACRPLLAAKPSS